MRSRSPTTVLGACSPDLDTDMDTDDALRIGDPAPDFSIPGASGSSLTLASFRGSPVVLVCQPRQWDPTAMQHVESYNRLISQLSGPESAHLLSINEHGQWTQLGFDGAALTLPVLNADVDAGDMAARYGVRTGSAVFVLVDCFSISGSTDTMLRIAVGPLNGLTGLVVLPDVLHELAA